MALVEGAERHTVGGSSCSFSLLPLDQTEAHLWYTFSNELLTPDLLTAYQALMCPEEHAQWQRFHFEKERYEFLLRCALIRTTLSRYANVAPQTWRFQKNAYGKPQIAYPQDIPSLHFNLSHTNGLVVCLVALSREVGIDVEDIQRPGETVGIADHYFSASEIAALHALPIEARHRRFFEYWTLKEAYIKARGMGLSLPLEQFSFHINGDQLVRVSFDPRLEDDPLSWQFALFRPTRHHIMAVAIRREAGHDLDIQVRRTVPLVLW